MTQPVLYQQAVKHQVTGLTAGLIGVILFLYNLQTGCRLGDTEPALNLHLNSRSVLGSIGLDEGVLEVQRCSLHAVIMEGIRSTGYEGSRRKGHPMTAKVHQLGSEVPPNIRLHLTLELPGI